jgi:hypothetical protein
MLGVGLLEGEKVDDVRGWKRDCEDEICEEW